MEKYVILAAGLKKTEESSFRLTRKMFARRVTVDRTRTPEEMSAALNCNAGISLRESRIMPRGVGDHVEVIFFEVSIFLPRDKIARAFKRRGLKPADPYSLMQVYIDDPTFFDKGQCRTAWQREDGGRTWIHFEKYDDGRCNMWIARDTDGLSCDD